MSVVAPQAGGSQNELRHVTLTPHAKYGEAVPATISSTAESHHGVLARFAGRIISAMSGARLTILIYHRVLERRDPLNPSTPDVGAFERAMRLVASQFRVIPLIDAVRQLRDGTLPAGCAVITFDDGYADNATLALPILQRLGLTATFFVATGFLDGGRMWNDTIVETVRSCRRSVLDLDDLGLGVHPVDDDAQRRSTLGIVLRKLKYLPLDERDRIAEAVSTRANVRLPEDLMMTGDQVRELHLAGMTIGGHTVRHPILARLDADAARREIVEGKERLEEIVDSSVQLFAFPNGRPGQDYTSDHVAMVESSGFLASVSTASGVATVSSDPFQLPRFTPPSERPMMFRAQLLRNLLDTRPEIV